MRLFDTWAPDTPIADIQDYIFGYYCNLERGNEQPNKPEVKSLENYLEYLKTHPYINLRMWDFMTNDPRYHYLNKDERNLKEKLYYLNEKIVPWWWPPIPGSKINEYEGYVPKEVFDIPLRPVPGHPEIYPANVRRAMAARASEKRQANERFIEQKENRVRDISERELNQLKEQINATQTPGYNPYYDLDNTIFNRYR